MTPAATGALLHDLGIPMEDLRDALTGIDHGIGLMIQAVLHASRR
jgi:hypothetical protein